MRALWRRHGRTGAGVEEDGIERIAEEVTGLKLKRHFDAWVRSTAPLPLEELLAAHGIDMALREAESSSDKGGKPGTAGHAPDRVTLGVRTRAEGKDAVVTHVLEGGPGERAGLAAGDLIVALDGLRMGAGGLDAALATRRAGADMKIHAFRRDELLELEAKLRRAPRDTCVLTETHAHRALMDKWLGTHNGRRHDGRRRDGK
jgi:predicted metalloprotease with PDZ domain